MHISASHCRMHVWNGNMPPGIESWWWRDFPHSSRPAMGSTQAHPASGSGSFPGVRRPGRGFGHLLPSSAEIKEKIQRYLYFPSRHSWVVLWWTLTFLPLKVKRARFSTDRPEQPLYSFSSDRRNTLQILQHTVPWKLAIRTRLKRQGGDRKP